MTDITERLRSGFPSILAQRDGAEEIDRLRARIAELEAARGEPVAWVLKTGHGTTFATVKPECEIDLWAPLYTAPLRARG